MDLATTGPAPLLAAPTVSGPFLGFDAVMLVVAACLAYAGFKTRARAEAPRTRQAPLQPAHGLSRP